MNETERLLELRRIAGRFIGETLGCEVPWSACAGPNTWTGNYQRKAAPGGCWRRVTCCTTSARHKEAPAERLKAVSGRAGLWDLPATANYNQTREDGK